MRVLAILAFVCAVGNMQRSTLQCRLASILGLCPLPSLDYRPRLRVPATKLRILECPFMQVTHKLGIRARIYVTIVHRV